MKQRFLLYSMLIFSGMFAQTPDTKFGQSRVQYKDFNFSYYPSDHFVTYFYQGGQDVGKYVVNAAEEYYDELAQQLDVKVKAKTDIIVYNTLEDLNQTNIGIYEPDQNQGGLAKLPHNRIFVYFNGSHEHIDEQVKAGIARVLGARAVSGKERETRFYRRLPEWFTSGLNLYLSKPWTSIDEDQLRDGIVSGRYETFRRLGSDEITHVGYSIFHYIEEKYGKTAVNNVIYYTRLNRSTDYGLQFSIGVNSNELLVQWFAYYRDRFQAENLQTIAPRDKDLIKIPVKKETQYFETKISPDGKFMAYATNNWGRINIHLKNLETSECKTIYKYGWRTRTLFTDLKLPLLAFTPKGDKLTVVYNKRAVNRMVHHTIETGKQEKVRVEKFQKITSINYMPDGKSLLLSAFQKGQSDIYIYTLASTSTKQITDDYYDDFDPAFVDVDDIQGIVFSSNREDDTLRKVRYENQAFNKQCDIFMYDLESSEVYQITKTPKISERKPFQFSSDKYQFLSDANGITNIHTGHLESQFDHKQVTYYVLNKESNEADSTSFPESLDITTILDTTLYSILSTRKEDVYKIKGVNHQLTNFSSDILELSFETKKNFALTKFQKNGKPALYKFVLDTSVDNSRADFIQTDRVAKQTKPIEVLPPQPETFKMIVVDDKNAPKSFAANDFQSEFDFLEHSIEPDSALQLVAQEAVPPSFVNEEDIVAGARFKPSKVRPYFVRFMVDRVITQLNNDPIITTYQPFNAANPQYSFQPLNILFKLGITDLLEDHKIYGGLTFPTLGKGGFSFTNLGYFLTYENLKKRWDKKLTFYHQSVSDVATTLIPGSNDALPVNQSVNYSIKTNLLNLEFKYPFDVFHAVSFGLAYRNDRYVFKSQDKYSHFLNDNVIHWFIGKAQYVFDNSFEVMENIRSGSRVKVFAELHKDIPTKQYNVLDSKLRLPDFNKTIFGEFGIDARHYQKLYKQITLATRVTFNTSLGNVKMMHYIGGTENNLLTSIPALGSILGQPNASANAPVDNTVKYAYQTIVSPVRGFLTNARNGSSAATANLEVRIPLFSVLAKNRIRSEFLRTFQIIGFVDAGAAWNNWDVFKGNYPVFYEEYQNQTTTLRIRKVKSPAVIGTGFGLRAALLGYFIKFDAGWGYDSGTWSKKPVLYLGFGYDF
jgi:Tol biopolymer transport system component